VLAIVAIAVVRDVWIGGVDIETEPPASPGPRTGSPSPSASPSLAEIAPLIEGLAGRNTPVPEPFVGSWNPAASWADLQPNGPATELVHPNPIDDAIAASASNGKEIRVRLETGYRSPTWLKAAVGTVTICDPPGGGSAASIGCFDVPRWWTRAWRSYHDDLIRRVGAEYDGRVALFHACSVATVYCEPFLRQAAGTSVQAETTRTNLAGAGYSATGDRASWAAAIRSWAIHLSVSRVAIAINPGQLYHPATGRWKLASMTYTRRVTDLFVRALGARAVVQNNSLNAQRYAGDYADLYAYLRDLWLAGTPVALQLSSAVYIDDLRAVMETAVQLGAHLVELPGGWMSYGITTAEWWTYRTRLAMNERGPPHSHSIVPGGFDVMS
jgi:hypothetical protein